VIHDAVDDVGRVIHDAVDDVMHGHMPHMHSPEKAMVSAVTERRVAAIEAGVDAPTPALTKVPFGSVFMARKSGSTGYVELFASHDATISDLQESVGSDGVWLKETQDSLKESSEAVWLCDQPGTLLKDIAAEDKTLHIAQSCVRRKSYGGDRAKVWIPLD